MDNKLILTLGGDFFNNTFNMYSANLSFKNLNFSIFLTAEQQNDSDIIPLKG